MIKSYVKKSLLIVLIVSFIMVSGCSSTSPQPKQVQGASSIRDAITQYLDDHNYSFSSIDNIHAQSSSGNLYMITANINAPDSKIHSVMFNIEMNNQSFIVDSATVDGENI